MRQLVTTVTALMLAGLTIALSQGNAPSIALPFAAIWLWLIGGNLLIGYPRFRRFIKRALAEANWTRTFQLLTHRNIPSKRDLLRISRH